MKFSSVATSLVLASGVFAESEEPRAIYRRDVGTIADCLTRIQNATSTFGSSLTGFEGIAQVAPLTEASLNIIKVINESNAIVAPLEPISVQDALSLQPQLGELGTIVNRTIQAVIDKRPVFQNLSLDSVVLQQLIDQRYASTAFSVTTIGKLPEELIDVGATISAPLINSIDQGIAAFAGTSDVPSFSDPYQITTFYTGDFASTFMTGQPTGTPNAVPAFPTAAANNYGGMALAALVAAAAL